ncbi:energy-coupling factor ABC transporter ATP-binding protein [Pseudonocardia sp. ICBG1293]|uniref:energy-coupling factor ABC transporter ATP-binding protein n=1 Tax=Pseudonocardia sp. ICBG1293 TaxID=2844382 RepID=UPI001CCA6C44|nr:ABC transporter ATP-binding protein [Pseudonocardia sp. ICBG1293]
MIGFSGVGHRYGERTVLREVTLTLPERRIGLVGANGSGKSTLARTVNGLVTPIEGTVTVDGRDPAREGAAVRRRVGFVFSDPDSQIVMPTAGEDVAFSLRRTVRDRAERARRAEATLAEFGLGDHVEHPAHQLSGGQKQLLALAAVLVLDPDVLVCDEPTTLLDLRNQRAFADRLAGLRQQVLLATHDLDLLTGFDRVVVLDGGRVVADDEPGPAVAYYRRLCGS